MANQSEVVIRPSARVYRADGHPLGTIRAVTGRNGATIPVVLRGERNDAATICVDGLRLVPDKRAGAPVTATRRYRKSGSSKLLSLRECSVPASAASDRFSMACKPICRCWPTRSW